MASTVKIKRSNVAGKNPTTSDIAAGELALNTNDGRLYSTDGVKVFEIGANVHSLSVGTGTFSIANGIITFPTTDGAAGQILSTDGAGTISWANNSGQPAVVTTATVKNLTQNDTVVTSVTSVASVVDAAGLTAANLTANNRLANTNNYIESAIADALAFAIALG